MTVLDDVRPADFAVDVDGLNDAQARLAAAVRQLLQPTTVDLVRTRDEDLDAEVDQAHAETMTELRTRHAAYLKRRDAAGMRRTLALIVAREQAHRDALAARAVQRIELPCLLEQLVDAVMSTQGAGGVASGGVHRWHYGVDAAELLADIDRTVRPTPARQAPYRPLGRLGDVDARRRAVDLQTTRDLPRLIRSWAGLAGFWRTNRPQRLLDNAVAAERWLTQAREVLSPRRRLTAVGECPRCGQATAHIASGDEWVRRPALEVDIATGWARCIVPGCGSAWSPDHLQHLANVLEQQAAEKASTADGAGSAG